MTYEVFKWGRNRSGVTINGKTFLAVKNGVKIIYEDGLVRFFNNNWYMQTDLFYNTNHSTTEQIVVKEKKAKKQNELILDIFKKNRFTSFTPAQIHLMLGQQFPITSVRRGISQLTEAKELVKTDEMRPGLYGDLNHTWKLNLKK